MDGLKPHDLRHTAAKLRRNNGVSIEDVGALLGHARIATMARYLARLEGETDHGLEGVATALAWNSVISRYARPGGTGG